MNLVLVQDSADITEDNWKTAIGEVCAEVEIVSAVADGKVKSLYELSEEVKNAIREIDPVIIFIEQFIACSDAGFEWLQNSAGIALVKVLRMRDVTDHIVLLTPFSAIQLVELDHRNLIVTSQGISLGKHFNEIMELDNSELEAKGTKASDDTSGFAPYIQAGFHLPEDERHNWANWWGIMKLVDVHKCMFIDECDSWKDAYPGSISEQTTQLKNLAALYLYGHKVESQDAVSVFLDDLKKERKTLNLSVVDLQQRVTGTGKARPTNQDWFDYIKNLEERIKQYTDDELFDQNEIEARLKSAKEDLNSGAAKLKKMTAELRFKDDQISKIENPSLEKFDLETIRNELEKFRFIDPKKQQPRILYVDDNADQGWSDVFQQLIYSEPQTEMVFRSISGANQNIQAICDEIVKDIRENNRDLVLLDLRLKNETGTILDLDQLSGIDVLKRVRQQYPGLPVMMTTASNKHWSYQSLLSLGADEYWMKEGIDITGSMSDKERTEYSVKNYKEFLYTVSYLCDQEYRLLRKLGDLKSDLNKRTNFWWESGRWKFPYPYLGTNEEEAYLRKKLVDGFQVCSRDSISLMIDQSFALLLQHIKRPGYVAEHFDVHTADSYPILIIQQLGKVVETIHRFDSFEGDQNWRIGNMRVMNARRDDYAMKLYKVRNKASHSYTSLNISFNDLKNFIDMFDTYMRKAPTNRNGDVVRQ